MRDAMSSLTRWVEIADLQSTDGLLSIRICFYQL
jgi:hypothetical protein